MPTFYTYEFKPIWPVGNVAFCVADDANEARDILVAAIRKAGCECGDDPIVVQMHKGDVEVVSGDY